MSPTPASIAVLVAAVVAVAAAWWLLKPPAAAPIETRIPLAGDVSGTDRSSPAPPSTATGPRSIPSASTTEVAADHVVVQAAGAVRSPGVYRLRSGARVDDLVRAAGGLAGDADADRVNLAAPLSDGERVWLPRLGEAEPPEVVAGAGGGPSGAGRVPSTGTGSGSAGTTSGPVDLNSASAAELETLPGVGPATAASIVAYREEHGRLGSVDDLLEVRGIGEAKLEQIRPMATVR